MIRDITTADPVFDRWFAALEVGARAGSQAPLVWEKEDYRTHLNSDRSSGHLLLGAFDGEIVLGTATAALPLRENLQTAEIDINVPPEHRRSGVGGSLFAEIQHRCHTAGRTVLQAEVNVSKEPGECPGVAFAQAFSFVCAHEEEHLTLALPVPDEVIQDLRRPVAPGYEIVEWVDRAPEELAESYATLRQGLTEDVPIGDLDREPEIWDVHRLRESEEQSVGQGRAMLVSAARDESGRLVGHTLAVVPPNRDGTVYQEDTYVLTSHRGKGLAGVSGLRI